GAYRHVADEVVPHRFAQALVELVDGGRQRKPALRLELETPVRRDLDAPRLEHEEAAGRQLPDAFEHRAGRRDDPQRQVLVQRVRVELRKARLEREKRFDLRREGETLAVVPIDRKSTRLN